MKDRQTSPMNFYNRTFELQVVEEMVDLLKAESTRPQRIINFYGVSGTGKTSLLRWLNREYAHSFLPTSDPSPTMSEQDFLMTLLNEFSNFLRIEIPEIPADLTISPNATMQELKNYTDDLLHGLEKSENPHVLMLFDDYDAWPRHLQEIFEQVVLNVVIKHNCALVVFTSRTNLSFRGQSSLNFYTVYRELGTFTATVIEERYDEYLNIVPYILRITAGLPLCVERLMEQMHENNISTVDEFLEHEREFTKKNYEDIVEERVLQDVKPWTHDTLHILSIPRRFNVKIISYLLPRVPRLAERYHEYANIDYLELIEIFGYLSPWNQSRNGYSIQKIVRQILSYYMQVFRLEEFQRVNELLLTMYEDQIQHDTPKVYDLVEYLYHTRLTIQLEKNGEKKKEEIAQKFSACVQDIFTRFEQQVSAIDCLNELKETIEHDDDLRAYLTEDTKLILEQTLKSSDLAKD